ncbi:MAG: (2Fe-2S)-binding protein [Actinobacteria bacterium]|nr:(2Fe-2S)-binding protein [Actinomycetota bacterium]NBP92336.1 (2Fe-2S)-binding protein [Actinomycetota bacterium]
MRIYLNGVEVEATENESVGTFLLKRRQQVLRKTRFNDQPRGMFCGIGVCFDCIVTIDGIANQRACITQLRDGMRIEVTS